MWLRWLLALLVVWVGWAAMAFSAHAQFPGLNCPGRWVSRGGGSMCLCPNGSWANYIGGRVVCSGGGTRPSNIPAGSTHCGGNRYCKPGLKCASGNTCIPKDAVDCGGGKSCAADNKCAKLGGCVPKDAVDCGTFHCAAGNVCAANSKCVTEAHAQRLRGGGPIDATTARDVRPFALMAGDAYNPSGNAASKFGYRRAGEWDAFLARSGKTKSEIDEWRKSGFSATVYTKGTTATGQGEVVIAFRGSAPRGLNAEAYRDWIATNLPAQGAGGSPPRQYELAAEFARAVRSQYTGTKLVTVIGHSLGGALAAYAGNLVGAKIVTFNAPSNRLSSIPHLGKEVSPEQTNIITAGDPVSDPLANSGIGDLSAEGGKPLNGNTFVVNPQNAKDDAHSARSLIKSINAIIDQNERIGR